MPGKRRNSYAKAQQRAKIFSAILAGALAAIMLLSTIMGALSFSSRADTKVDKLKNELTNITKKKQAAQAELTKLKNKKSSILAEIGKIDEEIEAAEQEIELQEELILALDEDIVVKEGELADSQQRQDTQYDKLKNRVRFMHERGGTMSYLSILLSSDDFSDFLTRYEIVSQISKYDKNLFEELKAIKELIASQKEELEDQRAEAVQVKLDLQDNKSALEKRQNDRHAQMESIENAEKDTKKLYAEIAEEEDRLAEEIKKAIAAAAASGTYVGGSFMWPLPAANNVVTCKYGMRTHPITGVYKLHTGVDLRASQGTKIYAANSGTVQTATYSQAYGYYVVINHGGGVATLYAHMSKMAVKQGQKIIQGEVVGYVGSTGYSTGPHLHFEIIKNNQYIDPITQFPGFSVTYK